MSHFFLRILEEGAISREMQVVTGNWKGKETNSPLEPPEEMQSSRHPDFNPVRPVSGF